MTPEQRAALIAAGYSASHIDDLIANATTDLEKANQLIAVLVTALALCMLSNAPQQPGT